MQRPLYLLLIIVIAIGYVHCKKKKKGSDTITPPVPQLTTISPASGIAGDPVKLSGSHLAAVKSVQFGSLASTIIEATATTLTTVVPAGVKPGKMSVKVSSDGGASNSLEYEVLDAPEFVDSLPPKLVKTVPEQNFSEYPLLIYGDYLSGVTEITFNGKPAVIYTNNKKVVTTLVPKDVPAGVVKIKIKTIRGEASLDFTVKGPSPSGAAGVNFSIVNIPPPTYIPPISNQWSCGFFAQQSDSTFHDINTRTDDEEELYYVNGRFEYKFDVAKDYNAMNYIEFTDKRTGLTMAGMFSYNEADPCMLKMVLISSITGTVFTCTFDKRSNGADPDCQ